MSNGVFTGNGIKTNMHASASCAQCRESRPYASLFPSILQTFFSSCRWAERDRRIRPSLTICNVVAIVSCSSSMDPCTSHALPIECAVSYQEFLPSRRTSYRRVRWVDDCQSHRYGDDRSS